MKTKPMNLVLSDEPVPGEIRTLRPVALELVREPEPQAVVHELEDHTTTEIKTLPAGPPTIEELPPLPTILAANRAKPPVSTGRAIASLRKALTHLNQHDIQDTFGIAGLPAAGALILRAITQLEALKAGKAHAFPIGAAVRIKRGRAAHYAGLVGAIERGVVEKTTTTAARVRIGDDRVVVSLRDLELVQVTQ